MAELSRLLAEAGVNVGVGGQKSHIYMTRRHISSSEQLSCINNATQLLILRKVRASHDNEHVERWQQRVGHVGESGTQAAAVAQERAESRSYIRRAWLFKPRRKRKEPLRT